MRRLIALGALALLVLVPLTAACGGDSEPTPGVASVDFTPKATIDVTDTGSLTIDIADGSSELGSGSVVLITNAGRSDHRLVGTVDTSQVFDTGTMQPGDDTTVVIGADGELHIADTATDREVTVTVTPKGV